MFYWSDMGESERRIVATSLDGTRSNVLIDHMVFSAHSLFVNQPTNTLYWVNVDGQNIALLKLDESGVSIR